MPESDFIERTTISSVSLPISIDGKNTFTFEDEDTMRGFAGNMSIQAYLANQLTVRWWSGYFAWTWSGMRPLQGFNMARVKSFIPVTYSFWLIRNP